MIVTLYINRLVASPRAFVAVVPKALVSSPLAARTVNTKMAASDDERWPNTELFTTGREETDHLRQLREMKDAMEHQHHTFDEHSVLSYAQDEIKLQAQQLEQEKEQKKKQDEIRHHAWE